MKITLSISYSKCFYIFLKICKKINFKQVVFLILVMSAFNSWADTEKELQEKPEVNSKQVRSDRKSINAEPFLIKGEIITSKTEKEKAEDAVAEKIKADSEASLVRYTFWLAISTFLLFLFTAGLWWVTYNLSRAAKRDGEQRSKEMRESLDLAEKHFSMTGLQVDNALKQTQIAREEFFATHRPLIRVRNFSIPNGGFPRQLYQFSWQFSIFNVGDSQARNIEITSSSLWSKNISNVVTEFEKTSQSSVVAIQLEPGEIIKKDILHTQIMPGTPSGVPYSPKTDVSFFIIGRISYEDILGRKRKMGFVRKVHCVNEENHVTYESGRAQFEKIDMDYEFED